LCGPRFRVQGRISCRYHSPPLVANENQHAVDLEETNLLDQADEHARARQEETNYHPGANKRDFPRSVPVDSGECRDRIKKRGGKYSEGMRITGSRATHCTRRGEYALALNCTITKVNEKTMPVNAIIPEAIEE